jgi:hypothetical protein
MQGKCLINRRILTAFAAAVALKNCNYQLQNFELFTFTTGRYTWLPEPATLLAAEAAPHQVFLQLPGRNWKMRRHQHLQAAAGCLHLRIIRILPALTEYQLNAAMVINANRLEDQGEHEFLRDRHTSAGYRSQGNSRP